MQLVRPRAKTAIAVPPFHLCPFPSLAMALLSPAGAVRGEAHSAVVQALSVELLVLRVEEHWLAVAFLLYLYSFPLATTVLLPPVVAALGEAHSAVVRALSVELLVLRVEEHWLAAAFLSQTSEFGHVRRAQPYGLAGPCMELLPG